MESLIDVEDFPGRLLHQAALWDNAELLEDLLNGEELKCLNSRDSWGRTPLHTAATSEGSRCLRVLIQTGCEIDDVCGPRGECRTALHVASEHGHIENIRLLVEAEANLAIRDALGLTPLDLAEKGEHRECMRVLQMAADTQEKNRLRKLENLQNACTVGDIQTVKDLLSNHGTSPSKHQSLINFAPNGSNTLLFKASEAGHKDIVLYLLNKGADARLHPVTKNSPLYIAAYNGKKDVVEIILKKFSYLVGELTMEGWSPLHAAAINGHASVLEFLLKFQYPSSVLRVMTDKSGMWEYEVPFDINHRDVTGQTILYLACCVCNLKIVDLLIQFRIKARKKSGKPSPPSAGPHIRRKTGSLSSVSVTSGISKLISKLQFKTEYDDDTLIPDLEAWISPLDLDLYCNNGTETALHNSVKKREFTIASHLLAAGADPNLIIYAEESSSPPSNEMEFKGSTCLVEACRNRDFGTIDLLLKHSARDDDCKALAVASANDAIVSKLLSQKVNQDPENKVNKKGMNENGGFTGSLAYGSMTSVMINWHNQGGVLTKVKDQWISEASLRLNPKIKLTPNYQSISYHAVTRLDLSNNQIKEMPKCILRMASLKFLSLAQNKLESLPDEPSSSKRNKKLYNCPWLEEVHLQDNRLDSLPSALFSLDSLSSLDVSNNKLQFIPMEVWKTTKLKELNLSFNLLSELPIDILPHLSESRSTEDNSSIDSGEDNVTVTSSVASSEQHYSNEEMESVSCFDELVKRKPVKHHNVWSESIEIQDKVSREDFDSISEKNCSIQSLNLAHNSFSVIPRSLSCLCPGLNRLNVSYNAITKFGAVCCYPQSLKHLDLSHNQIDSWPLSSFADYFCYQVIVSSKTHSFKKITGNKSLNLKEICSHKKHSRLENLRTLILSANKVDRIAVHISSEESSSSEESINSSRPKVLFPSLSMLDVSNNHISEIPLNINELTNLSVLNLSSNPTLCDLPPQMGLLSKLWNLNTSGCNLSEPLSSMTSSKSFKTSDIVGYLRSILENSKPYARLKLMVVGIQGIGKTTLLELLRQEGGSFKRKPTEHWAKRMGNRNMNMKTGRGVSISTVGIDIGDWTFEKRSGVSRSSSTFGPVVFRTWDFGGQTEYYATHQYFLSKRSLYLVVWKIVDGEKGVNEIQQWLINIQARAPNSPVIIVGTHYDVIKDDFPPSFSEYLQQKIRDKFINIADPEKCGLPHVLDSIEVSCRTRHNIKLLSNLLYDTAFSLKSPGSKIRLLQQKIPSTYLALEEVVGILATDLRSRGCDPVLNQEDFENRVTRELSQKFSLCFRDLSELSQATKFLHENGLLLHYDDATLRDLYFLDPQWLCDMLSHVVTIREINPFAKNGLMRLEDLKMVFKSSAAVGLTAKSYIVNLLNKFEVALTWDSTTLLIPSLLPSEQQMRSGIPGVNMKVSIPVRSRGGWGFRGRRHHIDNSQMFSSKAFDARSRSVPSRALVRSRDISVPHRMKQSNQKSAKGSSPQGYEMTHRSEVEHRIQRLLLMSYFPSGFWSRLLTRILADDTVVEIVRSYFIIPDDVNSDPLLSKIFIENKPEWVCWQTGLELRYLETTLFSLKQVFPKSSRSFFDYHCMKMMLCQDDQWIPMENSSSSILEVCLPQDTVVIKRPIKDDSKEEIGYQASVLDPNPKSVCQLLALAVEHIDTLLEDWYPSLGTRFLHTSEGKMLITRIVPCPRCLTQFNESNTSWAADVLNHLSLDNVLHNVPQAPRISQDSSTSDKDSGMGPEDANSVQEDSELVYAFLVEECILFAFEGRHPHCQIHGDLQLGQIAPDTVYLDLEERLRISNDSIKRGALIGRGAFGFVYDSVCKQRGSCSLRNVAVKMLQPIDPGINARESASAAYKASQSKWERDPIQYASKAYCTARQEINILIHLKHPNIVPLVGICTNPLSIVLELAPGGALDQKLKHFRRSGDQIPAQTVQCVILQIARALEYLHQQHIIYRDLKSENVLIWKFPNPFSTSVNEVHVKLADYGISRPTLPTGAKGFGGTEGFMAPEIVKYNGEEEYTEKVDCFSFGMFIYELITLHQPFTGYETVKELIIEGGRPPITERELMYPTYILDLMVICWSQQPRDRPSASQLVSIATAPEFTHLVDTISLDAMSTSAQVVTDKQELWLSCNSAYDHFSELNFLGYSKDKWCEHGTLQTKLDHNITSMCLVEDSVWVGDNTGHIHSYSIHNYSKLFSYKMDPDDKDEPSPVRYIHYLPEMQRACIAMHNGRMFLCCSDVVPSCNVGGEGTFVMTELGSSSCIHSIASVNLRDRTSEIWCGESHGSISIFTFAEGVVTSQQIINHHNPIEENLEVLEVLCHGNHAWTSLYPGYTVYQWNMCSKSIQRKLDCSKLVPVSESLKTIAIDECFNPGRCQITSLNIMNSQIFVGTNWGCIIIAESESMRPMTIFRPFSDQVQAIIPIKEQNLLVTLGKGYRPLIPRYVPKSPIKEDSSSEDDLRNMYALLWKPDDWLMSD